MTKSITRKTHNIFGLVGSTNYFGKFGSKTAGTPAKTKDIALIQSLAAWSSGIQDALNPGNRIPFLEDFNALLYEHSYMVGYILQEGVPEYDSGTTYYIGSVAKRAGTFELYGSIVDANIGNALPSQTDDSNWKYIGNIAQKPTLQIFTSGSGTYTTPSSPTPLYLRIRMVGGGGGGGGGGNAPSVGSNGNDTTFGSALLSAGHGYGGGIPYAPPAHGGAGTIGAGATGFALSGGQGGCGSVGSATPTTVCVGGNGGSTVFGGSGGGGDADHGAGGSGAVNTGAGGGGGGGDAATGDTSGNGGGSGAYVEAIITSPLSSYSYSVGTGGAEGAGGGTYPSDGGAGGSGIIIVEEYYK